MAWGNGRKSYSGGGNRGGGGSNFRRGGNSGGGKSNFKGRGRQQQQEQQDREWKNITGLFPGKSGHSVFINEEILECLQSLQVGDMLYVGQRKNSDMLNLSVMLSDGSEQGGGNEGN